MAAKGKGSVILKILVVLLAVVLWAVISIPAEIWSEQDYLQEKSRDNMNTLYEAERYFYTRNNSYVGADSMEELITFVEKDSSLQEKRKIGELTNALYNSINRILNVPALQAILPISESVDEIDGDLSFNTRYFRKYDLLMTQKEEIAMDMNRFSNSASFPNFVLVKNYVDSLDDLRDRIEEFKLQNAALFAQKFTDSLIAELGQVEKSEVNSFWGDEYAKILTFINDIKKTDIVAVSSVADRLKRFIDRINGSMIQFVKADISQNIQFLKGQKDALDGIYQNFISPGNYLLTEKNGILQLSETDSILVKLSEKNFYDPDNFDGEQRYLVSFKQGSSNLTVESPNLLDIFQRRLIEETDPIRDLSIYQYAGRIRSFLDSTIQEMNRNKDEYRLNRISDIILSMKEITAEMQDLDNVLLFRYLVNVKSFVDTVQTEKKLSVLKPMIENILNPMDTLAMRIETGNIRDLEKRMNYFGNKIRSLDSLIAASKLPNRIKRQIQPFYQSYEPIFGILNELKSSFNPADSEKFRTAADNVEQTMLEVLNGYTEQIYLVFSKKHVNHGYIENGKKSWESEE